MNESDFNEQDSPTVNLACKCGMVNLFPDELPRQLTEEQKVLKRQIYDQMNPRRRKFVDKIGFDQWDPFQTPNDPLDIRRDLTNRTLPELMNSFIKDHPDRKKSSAWQKGARECALGIITRDEKYQAIFDFCLWYYKLLQKEGYLS